MSSISGAVIMDDMHKPDDVFSDTIRQGVIDNYFNTIKPRPRGPSINMLLKIDEKQQIFKIVGAKWI